MRIPNYSVVKEDPDKLFIIIRDIGPWDKYPSVTNGAEDVVESLVRSGRLLPGWRLFYYDTEGILDELLVKDGKFAGFKAGGPDV